MLVDACTTLLVTGRDMIEDDSLSPDIDGLGRGGAGRGGWVEMGIRVDDGGNVPMTIGGGFVRGGYMSEFGRGV